MAHVTISYRIPSNDTLTFSRRNNFIHARKNIGYQSFKYRLSKRKYFSLFLFSFSCFSYKQTNREMEGLLERIEELSNLVKCSKKGDEKTRDYIDSLLDVLDSLILLSADRFMTLGDSNVNDIQDETYTQYIVHPQDIIKAKNYTSSLLLKLISTEMMFHDDQDDERIERASRLLAHMSGRGGNFIKIF